MKLCKKIDNVTNPTIFHENQSDSRELIRRQLYYSDINFLVLLRVLVTEKQEKKHSLLIFEAKNGFRQEK